MSACMHACTYKGSSLLVHPLPTLCYQHCTATILVWMGNTCVSACILNSCTHACMHASLRVSADADYRVDCHSDEYRRIRAAGIALSVMWVLGAPLFFCSLLFVYKVPQMAKLKIKKAECKAFIRFCIANARKHDTFLGPAITDNCTLEELPEPCLRALLCAANSVSIEFKPVLHFVLPLDHHKGTCQCI